MQFLLKPLFLEQGNKYLTKSHFSCVWPKFSTSLQAVGILSVAFTYLHAQTLLWPTISFNTLVCTLTVCTRRRPIEKHASLCWVFLESGVLHLQDFIL